MGGRAGGRAAAAPAPTAPNTGSQIIPPTSSEQFHMVSWWEKRRAGRAQAAEARSSPARCTRDQKLSDMGCDCLPGKARPSKLGVSERAAAKLPTYQSCTSPIPSSLETAFVRQSGSCW